MVTYTKMTFSTWEKEQVEPLLSFVKDLPKPYWFIWQITKLYANFHQLRFLIQQVKKGYIRQSIKLSSSTRSFSLDDEHT